jgi:hypothetical protein
MLEQRNRKLDLAALGLLALTAFLGLALFTFDPADPPSALIHPQNTTTHNVCGRAGALASWLLLEGLGLGAYYLVISLAAGHRLGFIACGAHHVRLNGLAALARGAGDRGGRISRGNRPRAVGNECR